MKKLLVCMLAVVICLSLSFSALAGGFVSSPSLNNGPTLIEAETECEDCGITIEITPYSERDTLSADKRELIEKAYEQILSAANSTAFNEALKEIAKKRNIAFEKLAVSDLFDISYVHCGKHEEVSKFRIKFKSEVLKNFIVLLHYNGTDWTEMTDAKVNGDYLTFTASDFSPFAIVVDTSVATGGDNTTGDRFPWEYVAIMGGAATACIVCIIIYKKRVSE